MKPILSDDLAARLAALPVVSEKDHRDMREDGVRWEHDAVEQAAFQKAKFIGAAIAAMERQGMNQNQLAVAWGKTRQYVHNVLNRNKLGNFTIDTMVQLSIILKFPLRIDTAEDIAAIAQGEATEFQTTTAPDPKIIPFDGDFQDNTDKTCATEVVS